VTVRSLLVGWANEQDAWVRHLVSEVVASGKAMTDSQLDAIYGTFLLEKALTTGDLVSVPQLSDDVSSLDVSSGLFLTQLCDLKNVNALAGGQAIDFNPKLTVVFGENACGKTGYVRVLKKAAAVRTTETILPDVSQAERVDEPPSARISFRLGQEKTTELQWKDQAGLVPFNRIDVFDSRATILHVDGDLNYVYTPGELARFPLVQQGIEGVRSRVEQNVGERTRTTNPFLPQFDRQSRIYPLIDSLGAATDLAQLKALGTVTHTERQEVPTLKAEVEALQTTNPVAQLKLAETVRQHLEALIKAFTFVKRFDFRKYAEILERWRKGEQQYERATQESFAGLPIPGLLKEEWRRFIQAGEEYLKTLDEQDKYPEGGECLYCRQRLSPEAVALLKKYRDYCNNDLRTDLDAAGRAIEAVRRVFQQGVDFDDIDRRVGELEGNGAGITAEQLSEVRDLVSKGKSIRDAIESRRPVDTDPDTQIALVLKHLQDAQTHNATLLNDLTERRGKREEALRQRQGKLLDLESRMKLVGLMPQIEKAVEHAKWVDKAKIQQRKFPGLLRSLTETSKVASEQLLNRDFERHFTEECKILRAPVVTLQFPGR
jgi:hypothetical protein